MARPPKTINEKRVVKKVLAGKSTTQAVREVYNVTSTSSATSMASQLIAKLDIRGLIEKRERLSDEALLEDLEAGLEANKVISANIYANGKDGKPINDFIEVPDFTVRHKWWSSAMQLKGHLKDDEQATNNYFQFIANQKNSYGDPV